MNIYIFNWRDIHHPLAGGAELSLWEHAKYWQKKGAAIYWFASLYPGAKESETIDSIHVLRKGSHFTVHLQAYLHYRKSTFSSNDIIIDSFHFLPFFTPLYIKQAKIIALINETARGVWFKNLAFPFSLLGYLLEPSFFLIYKQIPFITGSNSAKNDVEKFGIKNEHITVVHHGFNPPQKSYLKSKEKDPTILFLSRLTPDKGIEDAVNAVAEVSRKVPNLKFWIGGKAETSEYLQKIKQLVKEKKIQKSTTFFGFVTEKQKYELFSSSWVLVHPSVREGWGLNVIEANACGTVAVAYSVAGLIDSIQDNKTGLLVGSVNYHNLATGIAKLLADNSLRKRMEKNAVEWSKKFSWEKAGMKSWAVLTRKNGFS